MTDLFLIAHKVRGEPAFDIAEKVLCTSCPINGLHECNDSNVCREEHTDVCSSCGDQGHWWIIPTSGHQAFPYWDHPLYDIIQDLSFAGPVPPPIPPSLRDHYLGEREAAVDLIKVLGIIHAPLAPIKRRF